VGLTDDLAGFCAAPVALADETLELARQCVIDWTGVALAGARRPESLVLLDIFARGALRAGAADPGQTVLGTRESLPILDAVLVNGFAGHVLDFDDSQLELEGHSSAPTLPALLALAERRAASGAQLLEALAVGVTMAARLSTAVNPRHYEEGWHATATLGTFSAAAACGRLLGLDAGEHSRAIGLASVQAAGLKSAFGSMAKPLQVGKAAQNGILSALLAEGGVTAPAKAVEVEQGFAPTHGGDDPVREALELEPAAVMRGILFKYHASCHATHPALEAFGQLLDECGTLNPRDIDKVLVRVGPSVLRICNIEHPASGLQLKFSIRGTLAMAMAGFDTTDPESYNNETAAREDILAAQEKVQVGITPRLNYWQSELEVLLSDGSRLTRSADIGSPCDDLAAQRERVLEKFERLVVPVLGRHQTSELLGVLQSLRELQDVSQMMRLCVPANQ
jgi:2-methylcitrate dehydratase PrpD